MGRARYGILINYYDWDRKYDIPVNLGNGVTCIKDLYYEFYDNLKYYNCKPGSPLSYIRRCEVLINPVGELRAYRYCLTDNGRKRLNFLRNKSKQHYDNKERVFQSVKETY
jgi:hypothetical protein